MSRRWQAIVVIAALTTAAWIGFFPVGGPPWLWPVTSLGMVVLGWVTARWWSALVAAAIVIGTTAVTWWGPFTGEGSNPGCDPSCGIPLLGLVILVAPIWAPLLAAAGVGLRRLSAARGHQAL